MKSMYCWGYYNSHKAYFSYKKIVKSHTGHITVGITVTNILEKTKLGNMNRLLDHDIYLDCSFNDNIQYYLGPRKN